MWDQIDQQGDEDHSQWLLEQEEAEFAAHVAALNAELRELAAVDFAEV